ncbi:MAG: ABC transporter ATP-binding protein, partial [Candidatus Roseilinea sp.]|uniref:ABC transporter ATP-binding protein n=1 Tax=Candidatus Roseilinea sp. TaxID=2838777 RepID=UPI00404AA478
TTLLHLSLGWLKPQSGEIQLMGAPLSALSFRERAQRMALVPQSEHTPFDYTVLEYTLMGRTPHLPALGMPSADDNQIALRALEQAGIAALASRPVPQLSGGERQLMLVARALAQISSGKTQPPGRLLLLDEPTSHLDLRNKARIINVLRCLREAGVTILMTNHEPDVVLALADDVLLMEPGRPPQSGPLHDVFTDEALSRLYNHPIQVLQVNGHKYVAWT